MRRPALCAGRMPLHRRGPACVSTIPADKDALGRALGRSSCAMAAVTDVGFADAIVKKLAVMDPEHYEQASQRLQIKARRAMERREEQARHEKNLRRGKKRTAPPEPPQPVQEPPREAASKSPVRRRGKAPASGPSGPQAPRCSAAAVCRFPAGEKGQGLRQGSEKIVSFVLRHIS